MKLSVSALRFIYFCFLARPKVRSKMYSSLLLLSLTICHEVKRNHAFLKEAHYYCSLSNGKLSVTWEAINSNRSIQLLHHPNSWGHPNSFHFPSNIFLQNRKLSLCVLIAVFKTDKKCCLPQKRKHLFWKQWLMMKMWLSLKKTQKILKSFVI